MCQANHAVKTYTVFYVQKKERKVSCVAIYTENLFKGLCIVFFTVSFYAVKKVSLYFII